MIDELNQTPEVQAPQEPTPEQQKAQADKESKERSLRDLRERAEAAERRARELELAIQQNMAGKQATKMELVEEEDFSVDDDSLIEGKHLKKMYQKQKKELGEIKKMLEDSVTRSASANAEWRLKTNYNDFDSVVTEENIRKLATLKPALYRSMLANNDLYDKGEAAYDMIKSMVLTDKYAAEDKRIEENKSKPRSASVGAAQTGDSPLAHVNDYDRRVLSEERKAQVRRLVAEAKMRSE